jgi:hypothetical protein
LVSNATAKHWFFSRVAFRQAKLYTTLCESTFAFDVTAIYQPDFEAAAAIHLSVKLKLTLVAHL